jgi:hypothetical protein
MANNRPLSFPFIALPATFKDKKAQKVNVIFLIKTIIYIQLMHKFIEKQIKVLDFFQS